MKKLFVAALLTSVAFPVSAQQLVSATAVVNCGILGTTYVPGVAFSIIQDTFGRLCVNTAPFLTNGNYLNVPSVTVSQANSALATPVANSAVIYNTGSFPIMIKLTNSGTPNVTSANFDTIVQPNTATQISLGAFTNINYTAIGGTTAMQVVYGAGLFVAGGGGGGGGGSGFNPLTSVLNTGATAATNVDQIGGIYKTTPPTYTNNQGGALMMDANGNLYVIVKNTNPNGQAAMSASSPVVLPPDQTPISVKAVAATAGGATPYTVIWPNNTTGVSIKGSAGTVYGAQLGNIGTGPAYVKLYDTASAPTCGSGTPKKRLIVPKASTATDGGGSNINFGSAGVSFASGIGICVTTGIADSDTAAPSANTILVNIDFQ